MRDSIVATDPSIGLTIRMPGRWRFAAWRAFVRCCFGAFGLAERRRLPTVWIPPLRFLRGFAAMATVVAGANGYGAISALAVRGDGDVPASTNQRAGVSALTAGLRPVSAARHRASQPGHQARPLSRSPRRRVVASLFGSPAPARSSRPWPPARMKLAVNDRVTPVANNNANASHMTVCFIAASPKQSNKKSAVSPSPGTDGASQLQNQFGPVRGGLMALAGRPWGRHLAVGV